MRLLVVEDDLPLAESLVTLLTSSGYAVDCVHAATDKARTALERAERVLAQLLVLARADAATGAAAQQRVNIVTVARI